MTTLCLCDWVESDEHCAWGAMLKLKLASCQASRTASLQRDRRTDNMGTSGSARFAIPSHTIIQEYVS